MQVRRTESAKGASTVLKPQVTNTAQTFQINVIEGGRNEYKFTRYSAENLPEFDLAYANFRAVTPQMIRESFETQYNLNPNDIIDGYGEPPIETEDNYT